MKSSVKELTTIDLVEEEQTVVETQRRIDFDPYDDKTPRKLLERKFLMATHIFNTLDPYVFSPLSLLNTHPTIIHYMKKYRYIRSDLEVELLLTTNKNVYGLMLVSTLPYMPVNNNDRYMHPTQMIQAGGQLIDLSRQEALRLHLPYVSPEKMLNIADVHTHLQWRVVVQPICTDTIFVDASKDIQLEVWINYKDPHLCGFVEAEFQADVRPIVQANRAWPGVVSGVAGALVVGASSLYNQLASVPETFRNMYRQASIGQSMSMNTAANMASAGSNLFRTLKGESKSECVKPMLCPDLNGAGETILPFLGDLLRGSYGDKPDVRNEYNILSICSVPALVSTEVFNNAAKTAVLSCTVDAQFSYFSYFKRLFKYYRSDSQMCLRFTTASDVQAKFAVTVIPAGGVNEDFGDLPVWEVSIKGTTDFSLVVPYMEPTHWLETYEGVQSQIKITLMSDIPQPYDAPVNVYVSVFVAPHNLEFASLQSPCNNALVQASFREAFGAPEIIGDSYRSTFMGGYQDVYQLMQRYSSRAPNLNNLFPFPRRLNEQLYDYDIYDYIAQLYAFYSGSVDVKYVFTAAPTNDMLRMVVGNSNDNSVHGTKLKAGNSMVVTSQSVWPLVEFNYPYERTVEFDSLDQPHPHYIPETSNIDTLSDIMIRPGQDFNFFTLLPTPDWAGDFAVFQSQVSRLNNPLSTDITALISGGTMFTTPLTAYPTTVSYSVELGLSLWRTAGASDFNVAYGIVGNGSNPTTEANLVANALFYANGRWADVTNSGKYVFERLHNYATSGQSGPFRFCILVPSGVTAEFKAYVHCRPYGDTTISLTPDNLFSSSWTTVTPVPHVVVDGTVPVSLNQTVDVSVANTPLGVSVTNTPSVQVTNDPLPISGSVVVTNPVIAIDGEVAVKGAAVQAHPVWVTNYKI